MRAGISIEVVCLLCNAKKLKLANYRAKKKGRKDRHPSQSPNQKYKQEARKKGRKDRHPTQSPSQKYTQEVTNLEVFTEMDQVRRLPLFSAQ